MSWFIFWRLRWLTEWLSDYDYSLSEWVRTQCPEMYFKDYSGDSLSEYSVPICILKITMTHWVTERFRDRNLFRNAPIHAVNKKEWSSNQLRTVKRNYGTPSVGWQHYMNQTKMIPFLIRENLHVKKHAYLWTLSNNALTPLPHQVISILDHSLQQTLQYIGIV